MHTLGQGHESGWKAMSNAGDTPIQPNKPSKKNLK